MFLAVSFEMERARGIEMRVERMIVGIIIFRSRRERLAIWDIAKAEPVRDFWKRIRVRKEVDITRVLIEPRRIRNCSREVFLSIWEVMIAA